MLQWIGKVFGSVSIIQKECLKCGEPYYYTGYPLCEKCRQE